MAIIGLAISNLAICDQSDCRITTSTYMYAYYLQLQLLKSFFSSVSYFLSFFVTLQDLAARNILVSQDEKCKVADFGLARVMKENVYEVQRVRNINFQS